MPSVIGPDVVFCLLWTDSDSGKPEGVAFDAVSSHNHESLMDITEHPVEEGVDVVDNARPKPKTISVTGYVSNKPIFSNPGVKDNGGTFGTTSLDVPIPERSKGTKGGARPKSVKLVIPDPPMALNIASVVSAGIGALMGALTGGIKATLAPEPPKDRSPVKANLLTPGGDPDRVGLVYAALIAGQKQRALVFVSSNLGQMDNMLFEKVGVPRTTSDGDGATFEISLTQVRLVKSETVKAPKPAEKRALVKVSQGSKATAAADVERQADMDNVANLDPNAVAPTGAGMPAVPGAPGMP